MIQVDQWIFGNFNGKIRFFFYTNLFLNNPNYAESPWNQRYYLFPIKSMDWLIGEGNQMYKKSKRRRKRTFEELSNKSLEKKGAIICSRLLHCLNTLKEFSISKLLFWGMFLHPAYIFIIRRRIYLGCKIFSYLT